MGGTTPTVKGYEEGTNNVPFNTFTGSSGTQMQLDPTQRRFLPFNNLPANMYGPVTTGKTYEDSPYFIQPYVAPVVETVTDNSTTTYTPVITDDAGNTATYLGVDPYDPEGDDNFLTEEEIASRVKIIQDVIGDPNYDPNTDVLTEEQQALVMNQTTTLDGDPNTNDYANRADIAMDDIYNNNQQIYGTETGNNVTSLVTGQNTGTPAPWTPPGYEVGADGTWEVVEKNNDTPTPTTIEDLQVPGTSTLKVNTSDDPVVVSSNSNYTEVVNPGTNGITRVYHNTPSNDNSSDNSSSSSSGDSTVICTALNKMGYLSDEIYAIDSEYGLKLKARDPMLYYGYRIWALPLSIYIQRNTIDAVAVRNIVAPITLTWAKEMAHQMRPKEYKPNYGGKLVMLVGYPICRMIGHIFLGNLKKKEI